MRQNFDSDIWGPHAWFFLETVCMGYPTDPSYEEKKQAENFFKALQFMIPCEKCRNHYKKHLKKYPLNGEVLSSRDNLFMWIVDIHNSVHKNKQKTYDDTFNYYMDMYKINVDDECTDYTTVQYKIVKIPTIILIKNGKIINYINEKITEETLNKAITNVNVNVNANIEPLENMIVNK